MPYDPFDPEEIRRRQMLGIDPMSEDEQDTGETPNSVFGAPYHSASAPTVSPALTPSQTRYRDVIGQTPQMSDYQPSRGRRVLASIAGGLAGLKDAKTGVEVGQNIISQPYRSAMSGWQSQVQSAAMGMGLDKEVAAEDIARRRAGAYERSATARERAASATEAWRKSQEAKPQPWQPQTEEQYIRAHQAIRAQPRPSNIQEERQWMQEDPQGFQRFNELKHAPRRTPAEEREMIEYRAQMQAKYRRPREPEEPKQVAPASPAQQSQAEHLAAEQLIREDPKYASFYTPASGAGPKKVTARFKTLDELPQPGILNGVTPEQANLAKELYRDFNAKVQERSKRILGSKSSAGDEWSLTEEK